MRRRNVSTKTRDESEPLIQTYKNDTRKPEKTQSDNYKNGYRKHWIQELANYTP